MYRRKKKTTDLNRSKSNEGVYRIVKVAAGGERAATRNEAWETGGRGEGAADSPSGKQEKPRREQKVVRSEAQEGEGRVLARRRAQQ